MTGSASVLKVLMTEPQRARGLFKRPRQTPLGLAAKRPPAPLSEIMRASEMLERGGANRPASPTDQLHSSFAGKPDVQGGKDGLVALVPALGEP